MTPGEPFSVEGLASTNQGDPRFGEFAGSQCLSNCVSWLAFSFHNGERPVTITSDLDEVLRKGAKLDFILRKTGELGAKDYAQLSQIPGLLKTEEWTLRIFQSDEFYGLLLDPSAISFKQVTSLERLLATLDFTIVNYIIVIHNSKSLGILNSGRKLFLFDPHCSHRIGQGPAYVISTEDATALVSYMGNKDDIYTASIIVFFEIGEGNAMKILNTKYPGLGFNSRPGQALDLGETQVSCSLDELPPTYERVMGSEVIPFSTSDTVTSSGERPRPDPGKSTRGQNRFTPYLPTTAETGEKRRGRDGPVQPSQDPPTHLFDFLLPEAKRRPTVTDKTADLSGPSPSGPETGASSDPLSAVPLPDSPLHPEPPQASFIPKFPLSRPSHDLGDPDHTLPAQKWQSSTLSGKEGTSLPQPTLSNEWPPKSDAPLTAGFPIPQHLTAQGTGQVSAATQTSSIRFKQETQSEESESSNDFLPFHKSQVSLGTQTAAVQFKREGVDPITIPPISVPTPHINRASSLKRKRLLSPLQPPGGDSRSSSKQPRKLSTGERSIKKQGRDSDSGSVTSDDVGLDLSDTESIDSYWLDDGLSLVASDDEPDVTLVDSNDDGSPDYPRGPAFLSSVGSGDRASLSPRLHDNYDIWEINEGDIHPKTETTADETYPPEIREDPSRTPSAARNQFRLRGFPPLNLDNFDRVIHRLRETGVHRPDLPVIINSPTGIHLREAQALADIDRILTSIVIEHGLITQAFPSASESIAKNLLRFIVLWGRKLNIPGGDLDLLLESNLRIEEIAKLLLDGDFKSSPLKQHLYSKLNKCYPTVREEQSLQVSAFMSWLKHIAKASELADVPVTEEGILRELTRDFAFPIFLLDRGAEDEISTLIERASLAIAQRNRVIFEDATTFRTVLQMLLDFQGPPSTSWVPEIDVHGKAADYQEALVSIGQDLGDSAFDLGIEFLDILNQTLEEDGETFFTGPDFPDLIKKITNTLEHLEYTSSLLPLNPAIASSVKNQLLYLGGEIAAVTSIPWDRDPATPEIRVEVFDSIREQLTQMNTARANSTRLEEILDEAERLLHQLETVPQEELSPTTKGEGTLSGRPRNPTGEIYSLDILESYLASAATLVGPERKNARLATLQRTVRDLTVSERFMNSLINDITYETLEDILPRLKEALRASPSLAGLQTVREGITATCMILIDSILLMIRDRDLERLKYSKLSRFQELLSLSEFPGQDDLGKLLTSMGVIQRHIVQTTSQETAARNLEDLELIKSTLATSQIQPQIKRELYRLLARDERDVRAELERGSARISRGDRPQSPDGGEETMDVGTQSTEDEALIRRAIQQQGEVSWNRVTRAFDDLSFSNVTADDWLAIHREFVRDGSPLSTVLGSTLTDVLDRLAAVLEKEIQSRLEALLPNPPPSTDHKQQDSRPLIPSFQWLADLKTRVLSEITRFDLPRLSRARLSLERLVTDLTAIAGSSTLAEAVTGTRYQDEGLKYLELFARLRSTSLEFKMEVTTVVDDFGSTEPNNIESQPRADTLGYRPLYGPAPELRRPKRLLAQEDIDDLNNWRFRPFADSLVREEGLLLRELGQTVDELEGKIRDINGERQDEERRIIEKIATVLADRLSIAPKTITLNAKPLPPDDPIATLEGVIRNPKAVAQSTYAEAAACFTWANATVNYILTVAPKTLEPRLRRLEMEIKRGLEDVLPKVELERQANETDDYSVIERAIEALDISRIGGGKRTVDGWVEKTRRLNHIMSGLEERGYLRAELDYLSGLIVTPFPENFRALVDRCTALDQRVKSLKPLSHSAGASTTGSETDDRRLTEQVRELLAFATFKYQYTVQLLDASRPQLRRYPLELSLPEEAESIQAGKGRDEETFNPLERLKLYAVIGEKKPRVSVWVEVTSPLISNLSSFVPLEKHGPPIHFYPFLTSLLQVLAFERDSLADLLRPTDPTQAHHHLLLPNILTSYEGITPASALLRVWADVNRYAEEVLSLFVRSEISSQELPNNDLVGMIIATQIIRSATEGTRPETSQDPHRHVIQLDTAGWTATLVAVFPSLIATALERHSFQEAVKFLRLQHKEIVRALGRAFVHVKFASDSRSAPRARQPPMPTPEDLITSYIFLEEKFTSVNFLETLWRAPNPPIILQDTDDLEKRIQLLTWHLFTVDKDILWQLWDTLAPGGIEARHDASTTPPTSSPWELLEKLVRARYGVANVPSQIEVISQTTVEDLEPKTPEIFSKNTGKSWPDGTLSRVFRLPLFPRQAKSASLPLTGFEVALACLGGQARAHLYRRSSQTVPAKRIDPLNGTSVTRVVLAAPLLICDESRDPFKSFMLAPRKTEKVRRLLTAKKNGYILGRGGLTEEEKRIFLRQAYWLENELQSQSGSKDEQPILIMLNEENLVVWSGVPSDPAEAARLPPIVERDHTGDWPTEILTTRTLDSGNLEAESLKWDTLSTPRPATFFQTFPRLITQVASGKVPAAPLSPTPQTETVRSSPDPGPNERDQSPLVGVSVNFTRPGSPNSNNQHHSLSGRETTWGPVRAPESPPPSSKTGTENTEILDDLSQRRDRNGRSFQISGRDPSFSPRPSPQTTGSPKLPADADVSLKWHTLDSFSPSRPSSVRASDTLQNDQLGPLPLEPLLSLPPIFDTPISPPPPKYQRRQQGSFRLTTPAPARGVQTITDEVLPLSTTQVTVSSVSQASPKFPKSTRLQNERGTRMSPSHEDATSVSPTVEPTEPLPMFPAPLPKSTENSDLSQNRRPFDPPVNRSLDLPTVRIQYPQLEDYLKEPHSAPIVSTIFENLLDVDVSDLSIGNAALEDAIAQLLEFIEKLKRAIMLSRNLFLTTVQRLKNFYL